ncbi:MAG: tripartite tricarboxylate transporter substrate binding protein [Betaproteobacteria bacterium]|nr:tripartite tricarboxylate transporter substrate binding protein [Betaproteobacteria bacterium]
MDALRWKIIGAAFAAACCAMASGTWAAEGAAKGAGPLYPTKPIRMVVPFPPGAASDFLARTVGQKLADIYGQQVVIDNRPGAGGLIGSQIVLKGTTDGYTVAMIGQPHLSNVLIREQKPYDPLKDFTAVGLVASIPNVVVLGTGVSAKNVTELIALAKSRPGQFNFGSAGIGSSSHLAGEMFVAAAGIKAVHVPFKTLPDIFSEMLAGRVHFYVFPLPAVMPMLKEGRLKAIAVATPKRSVALPDVPTTTESGFPQYQSDSWFGIVAPAGVPRRTINTLNADIAKVLKDGDTRERFQKQGAEPSFGSPEDFHKLQRDEYARLAKLIKDIGMKPL